jgi:hypothetical protein
VNGLTIATDGAVSTSGKLSIGNTATNSLLTLGTTAPSVSTDTTDGADTKYLALSGGGGTTVDRGALIELGGNERATNLGDVYIAAGNVTGGDIHLGTGGASDRLVITDAGKVGIGTNTPSATLAVSGDQNVTGSVTVNSSGDSVGGLIVGSSSAMTGGNIRLISQSNSWGLENENGILRFYRETAAGTNKSVATTMNTDATVQFQGRVTTTQGLTVSSGGISVSTGDIALNAGRVTGVATAAATDGTSAANVSYVNDRTPFAWNRGSHTVVLRDAPDKLGLGTASPGYRLDVSDSAGARLDSLGLGAGLHLKGDAGANMQEWLLGVGVNGGVKNFQIADVSAGAPRLSISNTGAVGLGAALPQARLHLVAPDDTDSVGAQMIIQAPKTNGHNHYILFRNGWSAQDRSAGFAALGFSDNGSGGGNLWLGTKSSGTDNTGTPDIRLLIDSTGHVGIGVDEPYFARGNNSDYKLSVAGKIHAQEVVVDNSNWADYVFDDNYRNAPLSEVEEHIKAHGHLPGVPAAKEVQEKGVNVGQMQAVLLAKVEELTLHMIEQEKRIERLERENASLRQAGR